MRWAVLGGAPFAGRSRYSRLAGQTNQDEHWCDPDTYRVTYRFRGPDECGYRWDVTGPAKDQLLESVLRRLKAKPDAKPEAKLGARPSAGTDPDPETKPRVTPDATPDAAPDSGRAG